MEKIIVIGAGPAGISASLYAARAGMSPLILDQGGGALQKAHLIENYYGAPSITGKELHARGVKQATDLGVVIKTAEVMAIDWNGTFTVTTDTDAFESEAVILAAGAARKAPKIDGLRKFEGTGVSYCAVCDGFFYRSKKVAVIGNGDFAIHEAQELAALVAELTILTNGEATLFTKEPSFAVRHEKIKQIAGNEHIQYIEFENGQRLDLDGIFVAVGAAGSAEFARRMGAEISDIHIKVDEKMKTNIPGLFAAGDCTGKNFLQIARAVYEGSIAGTEAVNYIRQNR